MDDRIKHKLGSEVSAQSNNVDSYIKIDMLNKESSLPVGDINHIVDVGKRFNKERQDSKFYRFITTIKPLISNALFNITGVDSWSSFDTNEFRDQTYKPNNSVTDEEDLNYSQSVKKHLKEVNGWFGYNNPDPFSAGLCSFNDMEPKRRRFSFIKDRFNLNNDGEPVKNWELTMTYPSTSADTNLTIGGLLMFDKTSVSVSNRNMTAIGIPVLHNLEIGNVVRITGTNNDGDYTVERLGLDNGDLKGYYFVIDISPNNFLINSSSRFKKVVGGQESVYYFRMFEKIKTRVNPVIENDDYEIFPLAFSNNIYNDEISQMVVNDDIDVSNLTDNLGRPLSEIYVTVIKNNGNQINGGFNGFTNVKSGIEIPFMPNIQANSGIDAYKINIPDIRRIHDESAGAGIPTISHTPLENNVNIGSNAFYGDVVEYNKFKVIETVLGEVNHRFNTQNRVGNGSSVASGPREEGYYYKAHHKFTIRNFSTYIEQGDSSTAGIPSYAEDLGDGRWLWRDLLSIGFDEGQDDPVDYPFLNGAHYLYKNLNFTLKRQDPFGYFGLYYNQLVSADPAGDQMTDKFTTNNSQDVC